MLNLLKVLSATMHTVPLYVVGGMVCALCARKSHFEQTSKPNPHITPALHAHTTTRAIVFRGGA